MLVLPCYWPILCLNSAGQAIFLSEPPDVKDRVKTVLKAAYAQAKDKARQQGALPIATHAEDGQVSHRQEPCTVCYDQSF